MVARLQEGGAVVVAVDETNHMWCVVEYGTIAPAETLFIAACRISEALTFAPATRNAEWARTMVDPARIITAKVVVTGDRNECTREASRRLLKAHPRPRCNVFGFETQPGLRPVLCSNGTTYPSQTNAAAQLGLNQGNLSRHLRGELKSIKGLTFAYVDAMGAGS